MLADDWPDQNRASSGDATIVPGRSRMCSGIGMVSDWPGPRFHKLSIELFRALLQTFGLTFKGWKNGRTGRAHNRHHRGILRHWRGIGAALALRLAGQVSHLVLHARRSEARLRAVAERVAARGTTTALVLGGLADEQCAQDIVGMALTRFGTIDGLVANAGFPAPKSLADSTIADIEYAFRVNLFSFLALARLSHAPLRKAPHPRIVAVGSFTAHVFRTDLSQFPVSSAAKGALETAMHALALEMSGDGITVNCVVPGYIEKDANIRANLSAKARQEATMRVPLGRLGRPDEVAAAIAFLLSRDADYITGHSLHVNGGLI